MGFHFEEPTPRTQSIIFEFDRKIQFERPSRYLKSYHRGSAKS
jgi:hypothetical protein